MSTFSTATNYPVGTNPNSVVVGDFNKDGKPDLATANQGTNNISILLGTGTGSFGTATNFNLGFSPGSLKLGDFNSDGNLDIVSLMAYSADVGQVAILLGNGTGSFGTPTSFDLGKADGKSEYDFDVSAVDFNSDGKLDLVTLGSSNLSILLGTGTGGFGAPTNINVNGVFPVYPQFVVVEDFNADGKLDLATTDHFSDTDTDNIWIWLGTGTGSFGAPTKFNGGDYPFGIATGDFNGDNKLDLAIANFTSNSDVSILLGTGTGSFGAPSSLNLNLVELRIVAVADFNSDNKSDLALSGINDVSILLGNGTGSFGAPAKFTAGKTPYIMAVGDFNADGKPDLATTNQDSNNVSVLLNSNTLSNNTAVVNFGAATYTGTEGNANTVVNIPVTINSSPVKDLIVPIAINPSSTATQNSDYTFLPATLTFSAGTKTLTQNVAVTIKPDNIAENAETAVFNFGTITDGIAGSTNQAKLTINDKETAPTPTLTPTPTPTLTPTPTPTPVRPTPTPIPTPTPTPILASPGIIISPTSGLVTTETGGTDKFTIKLKTQPTADVRIDLRSNNPAEGVTSSQTVIFNSTNWNQTQTVTITGVNDTVSDGNQNYSIVTQPAVSTDRNYSGLNAADLTVTNSDNDPSTTTNSNSGSGTNSSVKTEQEIVNEAIAIPLISTLLLNNFLFNNLTLTGGDLTLGAVGPVLVGGIFDGYISGATVFLDANKNGVKDADEPSTTSDSNGKYSLPITLETFDKNKNGQIDSEEGNLVAFGGTDTATGLPLATPLSAPGDATFVTPLSGLVTGLMAGGMSQTEAESKVKSSLSIPAGVDLLDLDAIASTAKNEPGGVETLVATTKVQNIIVQTTSLIDGASTADNTEITKAVVAAINSKIKSDGFLDLNNAVQVENILQNSFVKAKEIDSNLDTQKLSQIASQAAKVMAEANQQIDQVKSNFSPESIASEIAKVQKVALGESAIALKEAAAGTKPISQVVSENTGESLTTKIKANPAPDQPAIPIVEGDIIEVGNTSTEILGDEGKNLVGTDDDNTLLGGGGNDFINGIKGSDSLDGGAGDDSIYGGKGLDTLTGGSGDDILFGGRGADSLDGGIGNDSLYGGKGDDTLLGGLGDDFLIGDGGSDRFLLNLGSGSDTILDFTAGTDKFALGNGLSFQQLEISQTATGTLLKVTSTGQVLATVTGLSSSITASDFGLL